MKIPEEMITGISGGVGAAVAVVDADEGAELAGLDLALVLKDLIGLDDRHGEVAEGVAADFAEAEEAIAALAAVAAVTAGEGPPAEGEESHKSGPQHPTSLTRPALCATPPIPSRRPPLASGEGRKDRSAGDGGGGGAADGNN